MSDRRKIDSFYYDVHSNPPRSFHFTLVEQTDGTVRCYIDDQPSYPSGRAADGHATHRYGLGTGRPYICYEPQPRSHRDARTVTESWARHTARYMVTGRW